MNYMVPTIGIGPTTSSLPRKCSTTELCGLLMPHHLQKAVKYFLERVMGIEPTQSAWKAEVLPLNYTRLVCRQPIALRYGYSGGGGRIRTFEGRAVRFTV